ncbi:M20/M25/M40 family metallo-hydrolase [Microbacterium sp. EYE_5]|uniref:M20/M25/M40 family metallo-hydrolase n=1 Tax=unclassified Microbacterium TaxID=2609290 RepID=UPI0020053910|nr:MULTISPECIES: M20/M25/M40 family metallo-hydrolase [unclassified Microbacterium]MCK6080001.1 M20/M25/M40 family metallo-hydrolase [Microbacterium sp. EYE_382]MCK6085272.1 M20/M25/M40 family metallo-hydrolase [Microbacterium sp. EYE_384]MCK6122503.1 M20/M25/M40 family metallo-hydrolase [Microbacterium sp. EYE_80]MCK6126035.1 M20/M25/M40 family metallo-hydrolase [Microbacterium sp. EYE_79]MCK6140956.1 M20/M25/M40 family metallo-hydrolase [Microbacterium sp. EYE_39]
MTGGSLLEKETLDFVRDLIRIDSVNTGVAETIGDGETRAARYVQERLADAGIEAELVEPRPGRASVVARIRGREPAAGALLVHAHLDVVPVDETDWTRPPFGAEIHDGFLYGRGAVDMKDYAGMLLAVARHYAREGIVPRRDLVFAFLADEESGGVWGAGWIVEHRPDLLAGVTEALSEVGGFSVPLSGRPGHDRRAYLVATSEKGVSWATLVARGEASHGSRPRDDNTVVRLARAVAAVGAHRFPVVRTPALQRFFDVFGAARGLAFTDETLAEDVESLGFVAGLVGASTRNTATPTVLAAGEKTNVIPAEASARLDLRIVPGGDDDLRRTVRAIAGDDVDVDFGRWWSATEAPIDAPLLGVIQRAVGEDDPDGVVVPYLLPASTDNKHFARLGIAGYGFVPLRVPLDFDVFAQFHAADERVPVDALAFGARVTERILRTA